jgi:hypothetical protein
VNIGVAEWLTGAYEYRRAVTVTPGLYGYWPMTDGQSPYLSLKAGSPSAVAASSTVLAKGADSPIDDDTPVTRYSRDAASCFASVSNVPFMPSHTTELWLDAEDFGTGYAWIAYATKFASIYVDSMAANKTFRVNARYYRSDGTSVDGTPATAGRPTLGDPVHVAAVVDGALLKLYVNGELVSSIIDPNGTTGRTSGTPFNFTIGGNTAAAGTSMNGSTSHVALYSRALTAAEIRWHYRVGKNTEKLPSYASVESLKANLPTVTNAFPNPRMNPATGFVWGGANRTYAYVADPLSPTGWAVEYTSNLADPTSGTSYLNAASVNATFIGPGYWTVSYYLAMNAAGIATTGAFRPDLYIGTASPQHVYSANTVAGQYVRVSNTFLLASGVTTADVRFFPARAVGATTRMTGLTITPTQYVPTYNDPMTHTASTWTGTADNSASLIPTDVAMSTDGSVTDEMGGLTPLKPLLRDGVVSGSPSFKYALKSTGLLVPA